MGEQKKLVSKLLLITLAGGFIYAVNSGIRNNYGILLSSIVENSGATIASVSFVFAVAQLVFGAVQPFFGILSTKRGSFLTLTIGTILCATGFFLIPYSKSIVALVLCLGVLIPTGTGALSYGVIIGAVSKKVSKTTISTVSGIINAFSGLGNSIFSPIINALIFSGGLFYATGILSIPILAIIPISFFLCKGTLYGKVEKKQADLVAILENKKNSILKIALKNKSYILLMIGFFTCGFHMAIITNHLPNEFISHGFSSQDSSYAFSLYGIATIAGSILSGFLCDRYRKKDVLTFFYGIRPIIILLYFFLPKNYIILVAFSVLLGFSGASTVPPVSGSISRIFGARHLATLFGLIFFVHQIGGFISAWLGGVLFDISGTYTVIWWLNFALCVLAVIVSYIIEEE